MEATIQPTAPTNFKKSLEVLSSSVWECQKYPRIMPGLLCDWRPRGIARNYSTSITQSDVMEFCCSCKPRLGQKGRVRACRASSHILPICPLWSYHGYPGEKSRSGQKYSTRGSALQPRNTHQPSNAGSEPAGLPGLLQSGITNHVFLHHEIGFSQSAGGRCPRSRCQQGCAPSRTLDGSLSCPFLVSDGPGPLWPSLACSYVPPHLDINYIV